MIEDVTVSKAPSIIDKCKGYFEEYKTRIIIGIVVLVWVMFSFGIMTLGPFSLTLMMLAYLGYVLWRSTFKLYKYISNRKKGIVKKADPTRKVDGFLGSLIWILPAFIILLLFTYTPLFVVVGNAFDDNVGVKGATGFKFTFAHFLGDDGLFGIFGSDLPTKGLFNLDSWWVAVHNSVAYAFISVPIGIMLSLLIASGVASIAPKKIRALFQTLFFLPYVTSAVAVSLAFAQIYGTGDLVATSILNNVLGLFGADTVDLLQDKPLVAITIFGIWKSLPFNIIILSSAIMGLDDNHKRAAAIDGAGKVRMFTHVTIPLLFPTIIYLITVGFMGALKVFPLALFGNDPLQASTVGGQTIVLFIFDAVDRNFIARAGAASVALLVIVLVITKFNRWLRRKVTW